MRFPDSAAGWPRPAALVFACVLAAMAVARPASAPQAVLPSVIVPPPPPLTLDDEFAAVARQVPAFGGMYLGRNEATLQVYLTDPDPATLEAVGRAIVSVFGSDVIPRRGLRARQGVYGFLRLQRWYERLAGPVLGIRGVVFTDIDERRNRLRVGGTMRALGEVEALLESLDIPREAVVLQVTPPVERLAHTLNSSVSPRQGGYVVTSLLFNGIKVGTLGFNVFRFGVPGFVTNSHASQVHFLLDTLAGYPPTTFYQSNGFFPTQLLGAETFDPTGPPCPPPYPSTYNCRYSDSLFVAYNANVVMAHGILARTVAQSVWDGMAPCDPANPQCVRTVDHSLGNNVGPGRFGITSAPSQPSLHGLKLHKVGRTTGWTSGSIEGTCADYVAAANGTSVLTTTVLRCQYQVGNQFDGDPANDWWRIATFGDSGSPVFRVRHAGFKHVELYGLLWGGNTFSNSFGAKKFVFSPIRGVQVDLGALDYVGQCLPPNPPC